LIRRLLKDPLVTFLFFGALLFVITDWVSDEDEAYQIQVTPAEVQRLSDQWSLQMRRPPNEQELDGLVAAFVKEEIYYREALKLNLDANDTIVRRRLVQKLTFLTEDIATAEAAAVQVLQDFYSDQLEQYKEPAKFSFAHRYFSSDRRDNSQDMAVQALTDQTLKSDPFMLQKEYAQRSQRDVGNLFGRDFAEKLVQLTTSNEWQGPLKSAYGWHAVKILNITPARVQPFNEVIEKVKVDWQQAQRRVANETYFASLKAKYSISYPEQSAATSTGAN
jgi:peptidyl-prolyl cis-trans isomerase C